MKKLITIVAMAGSHCGIFAQSKPILQSADSVVIQQLIKELKQLQTESQDQSTKINGLYSGIKVEATAKYDIIKHNLTTGIDAYETLHSNILAMQSKHSMDKIEDFIKDLNNPQSDALGFKLDERVLALVKEKINPRKEKVAKKIIDNIMGITKSPLVNSIPAISPALSIANSVLGLVRGASFMADDIDQSKITAFEKELNKYTQYYNALNEGNTGLIYNVENQEQAISLLQQKLYDQVIYFATTMSLPYRAKTPNEDYSTFLNDFFRVVNKEAVYKKLGQLQKDQTKGGIVNHDSLLSKNEYLKDANNHLVDLVDLVNEFVLNYDNYINMSEYYYSNILKSMDIAKETGIANDDIVTRKKKEFEGLKNKAMDQFKALINLQQLLSKKKAVQYTSNF